MNAMRGEVLLSEFGRVCTSEQNGTQKVYLEQAGRVMTHYMLCSTGEGTMRVTESMASGAVAACKKGQPLTLLYCIGGDVSFVGCVATLTDSGCR